jgi:hypothetical protein
MLYLYTVTSTQVLYTANQTVQDRWATPLKRKPAISHTKQQGVYDQQIFLRYVSKTNFFVT